MSKQAALREQVVAVPAIAGLAPISIRSSLPLAEEFERRIRLQLARRLGHDASLIQRGTVRFEDVNGPKGGVDKVCRIKLVLTGRPSLFAEKRAPTVEQAFAATVQSIGITLTRGHDRRVSDRLVAARDRK